MAVQLAEAVHRTMCYMGNERPVCNYDLADGRIMADVLVKMNLKVVSKDG